MITVCTQTIGSVGSFRAPFLNLPPLVSLNDPASLLWGVIIILVGLWLFRKIARVRFGPTRELLGMEDFDPRADQQDQLVMARGRVAAMDETIESPMTDDICVAYEHKDQVLREVQQNSPGSGSRSLSTRMSQDEEDLVWRWETTSSSTDEVPFYVETENGPVAVKPSDAELDVSQEASTSTSRTRHIIYKNLPQSQFWRSLISNPERTIENHISPEDEVLVMGDIQPANSQETDAVGTVSDDGETPKFLITTRSKLGVAFRSIGLTGVLTLIPLVILLIGVFFIYMAF